MIMSKPYLNFDLRLSGVEDSYNAKVIDSPAGQASLDFSLPFSKTELESFVVNIGQNRSNLRSLDLGSADLQSIETLGSELFSCLFAGNIAERFRSSLVIVRSQGTGLRVRLGFSDAPSLLDVPWELLFDADNKEYIGLSSQTPIIRKLDLASLPRLRQVEGCLEILVMISNPKDHAPLDVIHEWDRINQATQTLQKTKRIRLTRVKPSLAALQSELRKGVFHVFHYIGHGGFSESSNDGVLILEDDEGKGHLVSGQHLGVLLNDEASLQLAFLNSCYGGRTSVGDPFAGVGQSLLQKRIPAVIAMQFEITDEAAIIFASEFYRSIVDGYTIETAVAEARKMIFAGGNRLEWATPVLYTSIEGGRLLRRKAVDTRESVSVSENEPVEQHPTVLTPNRVGELLESKNQSVGLWKFLAPLLLLLCLICIISYFYIFVSDESAVSTEETVSTGPSTKPASSKRKAILWGFYV